MLKDLVRSTSLANLYFISVWAWLLAGSLNPQAQFARYQRNGYVGVIINVLLLSLIFFIATTLVKRSGNTRLIGAARWTFLIALIVPISGLVQTQFLSVESETASSISTKDIIVTVALVAALLFVVVRFHDRVVNIFAALILVISPFALWTLGTTVYLVTQFEDKEPAPLIAQTEQTSPRIVWFIFDEMDQRLLFDERPVDLVLPELDRLKGESIYATQAHSPSMDTLTSLPSLITGRIVSSASVTNPARVMVNFEAADGAVDWGSQPNLFSEARKLGRNTALAGWYHPYCRIIGDSLTRCMFREIKSVPLVPMMLHQLRTVVLSAPLAASLVDIQDDDLVRRRPIQKGNHQERLRTYLELLNEAEQTVVDPNLGVVLVHWSIPHEPPIYDRNDRVLVTAKGGSYLDNLALVDKTIGDLRRKMESAGIWNDTVLLVTSDHPLRKESGRRFANKMRRQNKQIDLELDNRVPFVLKLAYQKEGLIYDREFNTVLTKDLFLTLIKREISTPESVVGWLNQTRSVIQP
jgi:hypothetical protein